MSFFFGLVFGIAFGTVSSFIEAWVPRVWTALWLVALICIIIDIIIHPSTWSGPVDWWFLSGGFCGMILGSFSGKKAYEVFQ